MSTLESNFSQSAQSAPEPTKEDFQAFITELQNQRNAFLDQLTATNAAMGVLQRKLQAAASEILSLQEELTKYKNEAAAVKIPTATPKE